LGARVEVFSAVPCAGLRGDALLAHAAYVAVAAATGGIVREGLPGVREALREADLAVDALLGTGASRPVEGDLAQLIAALNEASCPVVSLDVPSGLDADSGAILGVAVQAKLTVTFGHPKRGLFSTAGHAHTGELVTVDIGVPPEAFEFTEGNETGPAAFLLTRGDVRALLQRRAPTAHKGTSGRVVVVAGSPGKVGAARLAARGALRAGAGLVTVATRAAAAAQLEQTTLEEMTLRLDENDPAGSLASELVGVDAFVLGPGLGRDAVATRYVNAVLARPEPVVVDADALHLVKDALADACAVGPRVLTPHPGEAAALLGVTAQDIEADRFGSAQRLAEQSGAVVVLKGSRSVIASPGAAPWVCAFGAPVLATGGTGDVLSGILAACLVREKPLTAASLAVALHALAGEHRARGGLAGAASGAAAATLALDRGVLAHEIADAVPWVVAELLAESRE
jgi:NAD(P)H-hydrate epimerase